MGMMGRENLGKYSQTWLYSIVAILTLSLTNGSLRSEPIQLAQVPNREIRPHQLPPQNINPSPLPEIPPQPTEEPLNLPISPPSTPIDETVSFQLTVTEFYFTGNTVFLSQELGKIQVSLTAKPIPIASIQDQTLAFPQLLQIAAQVAQFYTQQGYRTSGAIIVIPKETRQQGKGKVEIKVIEGTLEQINVALIDSQPSESKEQEYGRLGNYVRSRLKVDLDKPLNVDRLLEALQLLQLDPLLETISATLSTGSQQGKSVLDIGYRPADSFSVSIDLDNGSPPSVGSFERGITITEANLLGLGDSLSLGYINTDGSDRFNVSYQVPFNANNGTIRFEYNHNNNEVVESPFNDIDGDGSSPDITSNYNSYDLTLRQPIIRSIQNQTFTELALGLTSSWRNTQGFLFDTPFPLSPGADDKGNTRVFALRFLQDFTQQSPQEVIAVRSEFSFGIDALGATSNQQIPGVEEIPDSRFFAWRGQGQYVRLLGQDSLFVVRSNIQLADRSLVPIEQFAIGGLGSVLGYRQDLLLTDNGFFVSAEVRLPIVRVEDWQGVLQIIPFVNYGVGWNTNTANPYPNNLASVGLGLLWRMSDNFSARLDWGIPLVEVDSRERTWQENGLYFTVQYTPF